MTKAKAPNETAAYNRGYKAGVRKGKTVPDRMSESQFYDEAFLRLLPTAMTVQGWRIGDTPVNTTSSRMELCHLWAREAVKKRRFGP